jgi:hypothetical protein
MAKRRLKKVPKAVDLADAVATGLETTVISGYGMV